MSQTMNHGGHWVHGEFNDSSTNKISAIFEGPYSPGGPSVLRGLVSLGQPRRPLQLQTFDLRPATCDQLAK